MGFTVVLFEPQIPQNTGNIVRTCAVTGSNLVLVKPLGFSISNRMLKRAGLDYWEGVNMTLIDNLFDYLSSLSSNFYFFSSKAEKSYADVAFTAADHLIFGSETAGLPSIFYKKWPDRFLKIPMIDNARCLNLANSAAIVLYEAWRQQHFRIP